MKRLIKKLIRLSKIRGSTLPLVTITISKSALINNLNLFKEIAPNHQVAPVLKSNAYGHGLNIIAEELKNESIPFFVIDSYFEARALRSEGIKNPLLIIGYSTTESIVKNNLKNISFTITSLDGLKDLVKNVKKQTRIHLKIDTGMHRQGISPSEISEAIKIIKEQENLVISPRKNGMIVLEGICSHFSDADNPDNSTDSNSFEQSFTKRQIITWNLAVKSFKNQFPDLKYWHISATSGSMYKEANTNVNRLGIGLYGLIDFNNFNLKPVLEMKTIVTCIRKIKKGETLGYNNTFTAQDNITIATIPVGYNEGIDRRLSNKGVIKIAKDGVTTFCPILGRVSMNITIIDVSKIKDPKIGDEVIVFSSNKKEQNSIENVARDFNTISYEIVVHIPQHLRRIVID